MDASVNWDHFKVALAIARAGSLSRAAVLLGIDQSTAGRRLSALEADMGTILFTRSKTGFVATEAGRTVIDRAMSVERDIIRLTEDLSRNAGGPVGLLRLLGNGWMLDRLTRVILPGYLAANPLVDLRLISLTPLTPLRGDATISLWFEAQPKPGEFAIRLGDVPFAVYHRSDTDPDTLPWVSFYDEDAPRSAPVRFWERRRKADDQRLCYTSTDARDVVSAIRSGIGKGLVPMCLGCDEAGLSRLNAGPPDLERTLYLHAHPDTISTKRVQAMMDCLRDNFAEVFATGRPRARQDVIE
ncbi:MAG: LysR family transcriptional regulator [Rubricella sp.]